MRLKLIAILKPSLKKLRHLILNSQSFVLERFIKMSTRFSQHR